MTSFVTIMVCDHFWFLKETIVVYGSLTIGLRVQSEEREAESPDICFLSLTVSQILFSLCLCLPRPLTISQMYTKSITQTEASERDESQDCSFAHHLCWYLYFPFDWLGLDLEGMEIERSGNRTLAIRHLSFYQMTYEILIKIKVLWIYTYVFYINFIF